MGTLCNHKIMRSPHDFLRSPPPKIRTFIGDRRRFLAPDTRRRPAHTRKSITRISATCHMHGTPTATGATWRKFKSHLGPHKAHFVNRDFAVTPACNQRAHMRHTWVHASYVRDMRRRVRSTSASKDKQDTSKIGLDSQTETAHSHCATAPTDAHTRGNRAYIQ